MHRFTFYGVVCGVVSVLVSASAPAAVLYSETFESYTAANLTPLAGQGTWTDVSGGGRWEVGDAANDPNLRPTAYSNGLISVAVGNKAAVHNTQADRIQDTSLADQTGTVYISFLLRHVASSNRGAPFALLSSNDTGTAIGIRGTGTDSTTVGYAYASLDGTGTTTAGRFIESPSTVALNTTHFMVARLSKSGGGNYDRLALWLNPSAYAESFTPGVNGYIGQVAFDSGSATFNGISLVSDNRTNHGGFDTITVGTAWADVVPVPEPVSAGMIGIVGAIALRRRMSR